MAQTEVEDVQPAKLAWHVEDHSLEGARWSGSSGQALQLLKTVRNVLSRGVRVVPVTNEIATQPLIEGPLITVAEIATLLRESNGRLLVRSRRLNVRTTMCVNDASWTCAVRCGRLLTTLTDGRQYR